MKLSIDTDPYRQGQPLFVRSTVIINPGLTFLAGCNGSGKSSFLKVVCDACNQSEDDYIVMRFDPVTDVPKSPGEAEMISFSMFIEDLYETIMSSTKRSKVVALADLSRSGITVDAISHFKEKFNGTIVPDAESKGIELYILIAASDFEYFLDQDCMDVQTFNRLRFNNYTGFKKFMVNSKVALDKRYKKIKGKG